VRPPGHWQSDFASPTGGGYFSDTLDGTLRKLVTGVRFARLPATPADPFGLMGATLVQVMSRRGIPVILGAPMLASAGWDGRHIAQHATRGFPSGRAVA
jgi:hypothetical protein